MVDPAAFPSSTLCLDGEPAAIRRTAAGWNGFGFEASESAQAIRSLDTGLFVGPEGKAYRQGLDQSLARHLEVTGEAYGRVGTALAAFADELEALQGRMAPLANQAPHLWSEVLAASDAARGRYDVLAQPDWTRGISSATGRPYQATTGSSAQVLTSAERAWEGCLSQARAVQGALSAAVDRCCQAIDQAASTRFAHNPHGLAALASGVQDFIADHAAGLARLSGALKVVSTVAGVLSFLPVIDIIAAPVAIATAAAALAIDVALKSSTGEGSWVAIGVDAALLAVPAAAKARGVTRAGRAGIRSALSDHGTESGAKTVLYSKASVRTNRDVLANGGGLPRTQQTVARTAQRAGIDLTDVDVHLIEDAEEIRYLDLQGAVAYAPYEMAGQQIRLGPAAFSDQTTLVATLQHEYTHVLQFRTGADLSTASRQVLEDEAYESEAAALRRYWGTP